MAESIEDLAYQQSLRAIDQQYQALSNLRARAATVVAGASLVASFLGARALQAGVERPEVAISLLALLVVLLLCGAILWPYSFKFRLSARVILEDHAVGLERTELDRLKAFLALVVEQHHEENEAIIARLHNALAFALLALGVETFALLAAARPI